MNTATACVVAAVLAGAAVHLGLAPRRSLAPARDRATPRAELDLVRHRVLAGVSAALGALLLLPSPLGWLVAVSAFVAVWTTITRAEPAGLRRDREATARDLPQVVQLLGLVLAAGGSLPTAVRQVTSALPGPGTEPLARADARLGVGMVPVDVWNELSRTPGYERVGRALVRAETSGVPIADVVRRLGLDLAREERARVEDRARTVGVRAALPLGLCLLPAFLMIGIVPVIGAALQTLVW